MRELAGVLIETGLTEIEIERGDLKIRVVKQAAAQADGLFAAPPSIAANSHGLGARRQHRRRPSNHAATAVKSPMVGTVYLQAQPGSAPFARAGDTRLGRPDPAAYRSHEDDESRSSRPRAGTVVEILVSDSQPVEYGEPLAIIG